MYCKPIFSFSLLLFFLLLDHHSLSQVKPHKAFVEAGAYLSTSEQNPFWIRSNQYGIIPFESQVLQVRGGYKTEYDSTKNSESNKLQKKFDYAFGGEIVGNVGKANQFLIPEAYFKTRLGAFEFYAGRRKEIVGLVDTTLTSGSYIWSGNALPIPKIQISIPNYVSILGKGLVSVKGAFAHGWFGNGDLTNKYFLHQKYLYGRIGRNNWRIKFYAGLNHQVQWGGYPKKPYIEKETGKLITDYGNDFDTFVKVATGKSLNIGGQGILQPGVPLNDATNRAGNHLGSIDTGLELNLHKSTIFIYRQAIYDDGSLFYLSNISDGLLGISFKRKNVTNGLIGINFEYLNTRNQGGPFFIDYPNELRGMDNYFNNSFYGWYYNNYTVGNPFFIPTKYINGNAFSFDYSQINPNFFINNRIQAFHLNSLYKLNKLIFNTRFSTSTNLGNYNNPISIKQYSIIHSIQTKYKDYILNAAFSYDSDGILKRGLGGSFKVIKNWGW